MILFLLATVGMGASFFWWMAADLSAPVRLITGAILIGFVAGLGAASHHRMRALRSDWESHPAQFVSHDGNFGKRKETDDPDTWSHRSW